MSEPTHVRRHQGGCFCGDVRFEAAFDLAAPVHRCNCRMCVKRQASGAMLEPDAFRLLAGEHSLTAWKTPAGAMLFCRRCGIHVFGRGNIPELGGEYVGVNVNCLDEIDPETLTAVYWDGRHDNWDAGARPTPYPVHAGAGDARQAP